MLTAPRTSPPRCAGAVALALALAPALALTPALSATAAYDWRAVDAVLAGGVQQRVTPGLVAGVRDARGATAYFRAYGSETYGEAPPLGGPNTATTTASLFDMASCSKLLGPVTAAARLYQLGVLPDLDARLSASELLGPAFAQGGKENVTLRNVLLHDAGLPPDPAPSYASTAFGCPATGVRPRPPLTLSCADKILASVLAQPLARPPGAEYVYSDLSMITLLFTLGRVVAAHDLVSAADFRAECAGGADPAATPGLFRLCAFEAYWRLHIKPALFAGGAAAPTTYLLPAAEWLHAMPTYRDSGYRNEVMQGAVADANAYASGGVSGHAGVFSTLGDVMDFTAAWQYPSEAGLLNASTTRLWTAVANSSFSPRALGWITQALSDTYQGCGNLSESTFYHTGYTGTLMCVDPVRNISTVLLTTRVYPSEGNVAGILELRQAFNNAVLAALGAL